MDRLPIPPPELLFLVGGTTSVPAHLDGGRRVAQGIRNILRKNGLSIEDFGAILDFGCGCGRIIRQWKSLERTSVYGTDYNPELIHWCMQNLSFAQYKVNQLYPPTSFQNESFDFIYAFSVFTHLSGELQFLWMKELRRLLRSGGYLLITTHGKNYTLQMSLRNRIAFRCGFLVVANEQAEGTNACAVYHPFRYVRNKMARDFHLVDFVPRAVDQDFYLLKNT